MGEVPFILYCQKVLKLLSSYIKYLRNNNLEKHFSYKISVELIFSSKFTKINFSISIKPNIYFHSFCHILVTRSETLSHGYPVGILYLILFLIYGLLIMARRKAHRPFIVLHTSLQRKKQCHKRKLTDTIRAASQRGWNSSFTFPCSRYK